MKTQSNWHPVAVLEYPDPEDGHEVVAECDDAWCQNSPEERYDYRCSVDYLVHEGYELEGLAPGRYMVRYETWQDYYGEWDERVEIKDVPYTGTFDA